jgi:diguanylate cyclase (GGDEF)-like protein
MLVVDADAAALAEVARFGAALSIDVATAGDEDEAIMHARMAPPDAAFLGADLTGSGALARRLRELPGCEALPIAFLSAADGLDRRMEAAHAGASLFLRRPLDRESFAAAARQLTTAMRAGRARVLVVDEDADFAEWAMAVLGAAGVLATPVCDATTLLDLLAAKRPDLVVVDRGMPGADVLDLCRLLRADPRWVDLPIVCLSNDLSPETRFAAFEAGVDDFLVKPILAAELVSRVKLRIERAQLRRERSERDALTGLLLRRPFLEQVSRHFVRDRGDQLALSIGLIDLDDFKAVNDRHGHLAGDLVLAALGSLIDRRLRAEDLRARWGGEEFVVAFPGQRAPAVTTVLTRVLDEFAAMEFHGDRGEPFRQAFSAGVATFPGDGESLQGLLRAADRRLYLAKAAGRSRVTMLG